MLSFSFVFVYFYGGKIPYMFLYTLLILPVISFLYTWLIYLRFEYTQGTDRKTVLKGESIKFLFGINNRDFFLYPYIRINLYGAETMFNREFQAKSFSILPLRDRKYSFDLKCKYRGYYEIGIKSIEIEDFLGIFKLVYKAGEPVFITVHPRVVYLKNFRLKTNYISEAHSILNNRYEDMTTVSEIRKYRYGDSLKKIHWKLSVKMNEIMVRNYQSTSQTSVTVFIDLKRNRFSPEQNIIVEDKLIEAAVAVIQYCLSNWIHTNIVYYQEEVVSVEAKNPTEFDSIYSLLSVVGFKSEIDIKDIIDIYINDSIAKTNLVLFTGNVDDELYEELYKTRLLGYEASLVYLSPEQATGISSKQADNILTYLTELGVNTYKINMTDDIKDILES